MKSGETHPALIALTDRPNAAGRAASPHLLVSLSVHEWKHLHVTSVNGPLHTSLREKGVDRATPSVVEATAYSTHAIL